MQAVSFDISIVIYAYIKGMGKGLSGYFVSKGRNFMFMGKDRKNGLFRSLTAGAMAVMLGISGTAAYMPAVSAATTTSTVKGVDSTDFNATLLKVLKTQCDTNGDGVLTANELASYTYVDLSDQNLSNLKGIEYLSGVTYLDLSGNKLTSLDELKYSYRLTYLDISNNKFTTLDSISDNSDAYSYLKELYASGNQISDMSGAVVCSNLQTLDLSDNYIVTLPRSITLMKKLTSLDLSDNRITSISSLPTALTNLSLKNNGISDLSFASGLIALTQLDVSDNALTSAKGVPTNKLQTLYLEGNRLTSMGDLVGLNNCTIDLSGNKINTYSSAEQNYNEQLRLNGCAVTTVPQSLSGWQYQNGAVYYFTDAEGTYLTGQNTISGQTYTFGSDGVLSGTAEKAPVPQEETSKPASPADEEDDTITADKPFGSVISGSWSQEGDKWYLIGADGNKLTGWQQYDTAWYYLDPNNGGAMKTGWLEENGKWYYLYDWGGMATGWYKVGGSWFYSDGSGVMASSKWVEDKGDWYYLKSNGVMAKGWLELNGKWYHMDNNGAMETGWNEIGGATYYMSTSAGYCATGWSKIGGKVYYFYPTTCKLARNTVIDGYKVDENGVYVG